MHRWFFFLGFGILLSLACASIINGTRQSVGVSSVPTKASVYVDGNLMGTTPISVQLKRKHNHTLRIELDGYEPFEITLTRKVSGWVWGNLVFGGLPGLIIDALTGGLYVLQPEQVQAALKEKNEVSYKEDWLYITVTLAPIQNQKPIAYLKPLR